MDTPDSPPEFPRRAFLQQGATGAAFLASLPAHARDIGRLTATFNGPDSLVHGSEWQTLNPGFWQMKGNALRRRFGNSGERARSTGFPYHYETHGKNGGQMDTAYDPSLPFGVIYHRESQTPSNFTLSATFTYHGTADVRRESDSDDWQMYQPGYGLIGLALGAKNLFESYGRIRQATLIGWTDDGTFGFMKTPRPPKGKNGFANNGPRTVKAPALEPGDTFTIKVHAKAAPEADAPAQLRAELLHDGETFTVKATLPAWQVHGFQGIASRGLADFSVREFDIDRPRPESSDPRRPQQADCLVCYPLGDTLHQADPNDPESAWVVRFVGLFATDGERAEIRVADSPTPPDGWVNVPAAGSAPIVSHEWRRNTASIPVTLPANPADATLYYTVWKDGRNVTADPRPASGATGPGTGYVGDVPTSGDYVGRLPQLRAPYKLCGLSCHALSSGLQQRTADGFKILGGGDDWQIRDQPSVESYKHLEDYNFQVMVWEDDVWYMELLLYPPSTDDAYKVVALSIAGPTSRWQMMRHWNIINPGDHDYGMDDIKGPEQLILRRRDDLGQDPEYLRRNFQIVHHLVTGAEEVDPLVNPKKWRAWKMPDRDFTLGIVDARLWRSSQDTAIWDDEGWGHDKELYDRTDPTRALLGEEQFAWLQDLIQTDASPLICFTGLNGLHTVWTGGGKYSKTDTQFANRDRVAADYAGWVAAGADRVINLLASRPGVATVYGDVHNGCILTNTDHRLIECSFGPIGRSGGRAVIDGFGPTMTDFDGRPLAVTALYHKTHADPDRTPHAPGQPFYWNFLEMEFDPRPADPTLGFRVRNLIDPPDEAPRGGGALETTASQTGREPTCRLPKFTTLPNADVRFAMLDGRALYATRSGEDGTVALSGLHGPSAGDRILMTATDGQTANAQVLETLSDGL